MSHLNFNKPIDKAYDEVKRIHREHEARDEKLRRDISESERRVDALIKKNGLKKLNDGNGGSRKRNSR